MNDPNSDDLSALSGLTRHWVRRATIRPSAMQNERLLLISDEHWIKYFFPSVVYFVLTATGIALVFGVFSSFANVNVSIVTFCIGMSLLLSVHHWFFWFLLAESQVDIIVTNKRVIHIHAGLLFGEDIVEVAFDKMKTVEAHKASIIQSVLNYGTLSFEKKASIALVPHPGTVARVIQQAIGMI